MAKQRFLNTKFWDDDWIVTLVPDEKLLYIYLLTNPMTTIAGCYEISVRRMAFDTDIDTDRVEDILEKFESAKKIEYRDGWMLVFNFIKNQSNNPRVKIEILLVLKHCPDWICDRLSKDIDRLSKDTIYLDSDSDSDLSKKEKKSAVAPRAQRQGKLTQDEWLTVLRQEPVYAHIDFDRELGKAEVWIKNNPGRKLTKQFFTNWINRIDPPLNGNGHRKVGCDICLNHPDKDMITVKGGGFICDRQKGTVTRCVCNPKNGTT